MNVLFISSGDLRGEVNVIVKNQGESLRKAGVELDYFVIKGKGLWAYLKHIILLRRHISKSKYNLIHAHYSLSAIAASLAGCRPLIVSFMGSDSRVGVAGRLVIRIFDRFFWDHVIVKSEQMKKGIGLGTAEVMPNGVDMTKAKPYHDTGKSISRQKIILFASNPARKSKNYSLAASAVGTLEDKDYILKVLYSVPHEELLREIGRASVVLLTSLWEGSPNIVKEAMACNIPVVSTDVGDVKWLFGDEKGMFITSYDPADVADKIGKAISHGKPTKGRQRLLELGLDSETVSQRIKVLYENKNRNRSDNN